MFNAKKAVEKLDELCDPKGVNISSLKLREILLAGQENEPLHISSMKTEWVEEVDGRLARLEASVFGDDGVPSNPTSPQEIKDVVCTKCGAGWITPDKEVICPKCQSKVVLIKDVYKTFVFGGEPSKPTDVFTDMAKFQAEQMLKPLPSKADRCIHGVHGEDCFECYPSKPEKPVMGEYYRSKCDRCGKFFEHNDPLRLWCFECSGKTNRPLPPKAEKCRQCLNPNEKGICTCKTEKAECEHEGELTFDARTWAKAFNQTLVKLGYQPHDEGLLIGWFANAIMKGYDHAKQDDTIRISRKVAEEWVNDHLNPFKDHKLFDEIRRALEG